jgi:hypothetical protein
MRMSRAVRKATLAVHLAVSIGWVGAVIAYLALDVTVATSADPEVVRASWISMGGIVTWVIVPLAVTALLTGILISLGTRWGLIRHWWVLISLLLTVFATVVLFIESGVIRRNAELATAGSSESILDLPPTLPHSVGGLVVLLVVLVLNVYKPRGLTRYGWRRIRQEKAALPSGHDRYPRE